MLATVTHYVGVATIHRTRRLPVPGRVVARKGQKVGSNDVVAEAILAPEHLLLDVAHLLGVSIAKAEKLIQYKAGSEVGEGDIIAGPVGLARRVVRAPKAGRVMIAAGGQVLMELESRPYELKAGIPGVVGELIGDSGVEIETIGAILQGAWGNGGIDFGLISVLCKTPDELLTADRLDVSQRGSVIVSGRVEDEAVFGAASDIPLRGIILGSMPSSLVPAAQKAKTPVILLEGFGTLPINSAAYKLLTSSDRREAAVLAEPWNRLEGKRPEIIIPLSVSESPELGLEAEGYGLNQPVRISSGPHAAQTGVISSIRPGLSALESGMMVPAADVRLESGESVLVPLSNVEVLK